jgi:hypothetical protein
MRTRPWLADIDWRDWLAVVPRWCQWQALAAGLLGVLVLGFWLYRETPSDPELPRELEPRAERFAQAWLASDMRTMARLTVPDGFLVRWLHETTPPSWLDAAGAAPNVTVHGQAGDRAQVAVEFRSASDPVVDAGSVVLQLQWVARDDTWFFVPPSRPGDVANHED